MASIAKRSIDAGARYDVRWRVPDGTVWTKTFRRRSDADTFRRHVEAQELVGVVTDTRLGTINLSELAEEWLRSVPTKRATSAERDRSILACHVLPVLGARQVRSITRRDVQGLVDTLAVSHAPSTVARMFSSLRALLSYAERSEMIARNPTKGVRLPRVPLVSRPVLDADQLSAVADALGPDQAPLMWLGVVLGLRWGEVAGLRVGRIDFLRHSVTVAEQLGRDLRTGPPKSEAGRRTLAAPAWLIDDLAALLARRSVDASRGNELAFVTSDGAPLFYTSWRRAVWVPAVTAAGLPGLRFHDLRSNAATALVAAGVDLKTTQTRMGHANPSLTLAVYARATAEADRLAADAVGERFHPRDGRAIWPHTNPLKMIADNSETTR
ncbi:MAG: site-specific integrase [Actinomycetota bacterium]|nr:site-specific integrase [Actinomycetota bacterium]